MQECEHRRSTTGTALRLNEQAAPRCSVEGMTLRDHRWRRTWEGGLLACVFHGRKWCRLAQRDGQVAATRPLGGVFSLTQVRGLRERAPFLLLSLLLDPESFLLIGFRAPLNHEHNPDDAAKESEAQDFIDHSLITPLHPQVYRTKMNSSCRKALEMHLGNRPEHNYCDSRQTEILALATGKMPRLRVTSWKASLVFWTCATEQSAASGSVIALVRLQTTIPPWPLWLGPRRDEKADA